jgi:hypothetical protein
VQAATDPEYPDKYPGTTAPTKQSYKFEIQEFNGNEDLQFCRCQQHIKKKSMRNKKFAPLSSTNFLSLYAVDEVLKKLN